MKRSAFGHKTPLEKEIQSAICQHLDDRKHFWWRNHSGAFETEHRGYN
jgi:hypothetical protein